MPETSKLYYRKKPNFTTDESNQLVLNGFLQQYQQPDIKRTHLFGSRYENIYLNEKHIPELKWQDAP